MHKESFYGLYFDYKKTRINICSIFNTGLYVRGWFSKWRRPCRTTWRRLKIGHTF